MSTTRWIVRVLLVLVLLLMVGAIFQARRRQQPDFYWNRAQSALAAGNPNEAKIHLLRMVKDFPNDARGHQGLAAAMVKEAKLPDTAEGYALHPAALNELTEAGRLNEGEPGLQKLLLSACLYAGRVGPAAAAGARVAKTEPQNPDVLYARAWKESDAGEKDAALRLLDQLPDEEQQSFRTLGLRAQTLSKQDSKDPRLPAALDAIATRAGQLTSEQLAKLNAAEFANMARLLPASVAMADNIAAAQQRAGDAISVCERLSGATPGRAQAATQMAAQIAGKLVEKFPALTATPEQVAAQKQLSERLDKLLAGSATAEKADWYVASQAAVLAYNKGEFAAALTLTEKALAAHRADKNARPEPAQAMHFLAAQALVRLQRFREAKEHLERLAEDKRTSGPGQLMLGEVALQEGRHQDALTHFNRAERELGPNPIVRIDLATTLLYLGKWDEALPYLGLMHSLVALDNPEVQALLKQLQLTDAQIHYEEARALLALQRGPEAESHLAALAGTAVEPRGVELRAASLLARGQREQADTLLSQGLSKYPQDLRLLGLRAAVLQQLGKPDESLALLAAAAAKAPNDLSLQLMLVQAQAGFGKYDEALALLTALEQKHPESVPIWLVRAKVLIQAGRTDEAKAVAEKIHNAPATEAAGSLLGAMAALRANDPKRAAESLKGETADNLQLRCLEGLTAAILGDHATAIAALGESLRVTSLRGAAGPLLGLSVVKLAEKEGPAAAERALAPVVAASPDDSFVLIAQENLLVMQGKFEAALSVLDRLEQVDKESPSGPHLRAVVFSQMNDPQSALKECQRALEKEPRYLPSLALAAQLQFATRAYAAAIENAQAVLAIAPTSWQLAVLKSEAQWAAGKQAEALATTQQLIERQPDLADGPRQLVNLQMRGGQYEPALAACRLARGKFKDDVGLAVQEVVLLHLSHQGDPGDALAKQFVGEPANAVKALALADAFAAVKDFGRAEQWGQIALGTAKGNELTGVHLFLGSLGLAQNAALPDRKLLEQARDHFAAVLKDVPNHFVAGNNLAWLLAVDFEKPAEAVPVVERARGDAPIARLPLSFVDTLATVYRRAGESNKAAPLLEQALAAHPDEAVLKFHLGMIFGQMGPARASDAKRLLRDSLTAALSPAYTAEAKQELQRIAAVEAEAAAKAETAAAAKEAAAIAAAEAKESARKAATQKANKSAVEKKRGN